jgi:hypothetical protein
MGGAKDPPLTNPPARSGTKTSRPRSSVIGAIRRLSRNEDPASSICPLLIRHFPRHQPSSINPQQSCPISALPLPILSLFRRFPPFFLRPFLPGKIDVSPFWTMCLVGKRREIEGLGKDASARMKQRLPIPEAPKPARPRRLSAPALVAHDRTPRRRGIKSNYEKAQ